MSNGKLGTADDIDFCLGTEFSHPYMMFVYEDGTIRSVPPSEGEVRKMIGELDDVSDDVKEAAIGALNVIFKLSDGKLEFLKST